MENKITSNGHSKYNPPPKVPIKAIGGFDEYGHPDKKWHFDGTNIPGSIRVCLCADGAVFFGGYTIGELKAINQ